MTGSRAYSISASIARRIGAGSDGHAATILAKSGSSAPDSANQREIRPCYTSGMVRPD
jgi:hypothetical protein